MPFRPIAYFDDINGINLIPGITNMMLNWPGENVFICGKALHHHYRVCGVQISMFTPQHYYLKFKTRCPSERAKALEKILSSVSGNTHFVLIQAGTIKGITKHVLYMRTF